MYFTKPPTINLICLHFFNFFMKIWRTSRWNSFSVIDRLNYLKIVYYYPFLSINNRIWMRLTILFFEHFLKVINFINWVYRPVYIILCLHILVLFWGTRITQKTTSCWLDLNPRQTVPQSNTLGSWPTGCDKRTALETIRRKIVKNNLIINLQTGGDEPRGDDSDHP